MAKRRLQPSDWGLQTNQQGELMVGMHSTVSLAHKHGTPLHVLNEARLEETARQFAGAASASYPGETAVHYAFKCNALPTVLSAVKRAGLKAEVMTEFELELALAVGFIGEEIIVNGPCKTSSFLDKCLEASVGLLVIDSLDELNVLDHLLQERKQQIDVLLRVNPDYVPKGMNQGSATGSRKGCAFGLDMKGGEMPMAFHLLDTCANIRFAGYHFHIGTGIRRPADYSRALRCLGALKDLAREKGFMVTILDIGGGFASMTTREMTTSEMLFYQGFQRMPAGEVQDETADFSAFTRAISDSIHGVFRQEELPMLIYEPGRCIASPNQILLLTIHRVKERSGAGKWYITDGGLGTVTLPTFYEYHEIYLCNDVNRPLTKKANLIGPACFAGDVVYRNKPLPDIYPGEIIAIMDSGAYFLALESSFGFPRSAVVSVNANEEKLIRRRETFSDMTMRDIFDVSTRIEEEAS